MPSLPIAKLMKKKVTNKKIKWFQDNLIEWFERNGRKFPWRSKSVSTYGKIVSEVLLQRTKAETVAVFYKIFIGKYPSWKKLAMAREKDLEKFLQPIGLWRQRSKSLKKLANELARRNGRFPKRKEEVERLPGVGQYITNAILLFCHKQPQPLIDVNMSRLLERFFGPRRLADIRYDPYLQALSSKVINYKSPVTMNWAILDFAATVCKSRRPFCNQCFLRQKCRYFTKKNKKT